jgi:glycogen debranching enzyme
LFVDHYTGRNNSSYHRGDSWFFINNIAAICMLRTDKVKFRKYIDSIVDAGAREILWSGAAGHAAEISDANHLSSQGCFSQAWSNATFIELMLELNQKI